MRNYLIASLMAMLMWAMPAQADYMATGFAANTGAPLADRFMTTLVIPTAFSWSQLPVTSVPFSVTTGLSLTGIDCIVDPSTWTDDDYIDIEVYTHTDSSGDNGTASGMVLRVGAIDTSKAVQMFHYGGPLVSVSETEGSLSLKLVTSGWTAGTIQMQCSIRYDGA